MITGPSYLFHCSTQAPERMCPSAGLLRAARANQKKRKLSERLLSSIFVLVPHHDEDENLQGKFFFLSRPGFESTGKGFWTTYVP